MGRKMTQAEQLAIGLERCGYREVISRSKKYRTFERGEEQYRYFVGKAGALRFGKNADDSASVQFLVRRRVLAMGTAEEKPQ
jgi:hypothetical protein